MINKDLANTKIGEFEFPIERGKIREFANAILDPNPIYRDRDYARQKGFSDVLMPVTFPVSFALHMDSENFILEMSEKIGMDPAKSVHGETEMIFHRPVCAGETLRADIGFGDIFEKEGKRGGKMTFVIIEIKVFDEKNNLAVVIKNTHIEKS